MRREKVEHVVTTGKNCGKRGRIRQREDIFDGSLLYHGKLSTRDMIHIVINQ